MADRYFDYEVENEYESGSEAGDYEDVSPDDDALFGADDSMDDANDDVPREGSQSSIPGSGPDSDEPPDGRELCPVCLDGDCPYGDDMRAQGDPNVGHRVVVADFEDCNCCQMKPGIDYSFRWDGQEGEWVFVAWLINRRPDIEKYRAEAERNAQLVLV